MKFKELVTDIRGIKTVVDMRKLISNLSELNIKLGALFISEDLAKAYINNMEPSLEVWNFELISENGIYYHRGEFDGIKVIWAQITEKKTLSDKIYEVKNPTTRHAVVEDFEPSVTVKDVKEAIKNIKTRIQQQTGNECDAAIARDYALLIIDEEIGKRLI